MKHNVFTDGNGGTCVLIEGKGGYVPLDDLNELAVKYRKLHAAALAVASDYENAIDEFADNAEQSYDLLQALQEQLGTE